MLYLVSLDGTTKNLPYHPDMPAWQYLREIIAPTAKFTIVKGKTVLERVVAKGRAFNFENKNRPLSEMIEDEGKLCFMLPLGPSWGTLEGNACPDGGDASGCSVCMEADYDFSLQCLHRYHANCLLQAHTTQCPVCRTEFTERDHGQLACMQRILQATGVKSLSKRV